MPLSEDVRRVVTTVDGTGKAVVLTFVLIDAKEP
jgi:hypothetical protein